LAGHGGDSSFVQKKLKEVIKISSSYSAFSAELTNGSVLHWGQAAHYRDGFEGATTVKTRNCWSTYGATAVLARGSLWTCGNPDKGGDSSSVRDQLIDVDGVYSTGYAFAAKLANRTVVTWGGAAYGGDNSPVRAELDGVVAIYSNDFAFAARLANGSVVTWGWDIKGGDIAFDMPEWLGD
jgi:hypothetical protein